MLDPESLFKLQKLKYQMEADEDFLTPYIDHEEILKRAKANIPSSPTPTASDFASWVFNLYNKTNPSSLKVGKEIEKKLRYVGKIG
jgi:hypothetical protein